MINLNSTGRVALLFSGGVESTLLLYLLLEKNSFDSLTVFLIDRFNNPIARALNVYNSVKERLANTTSQLKILKIPVLEQSEEIRYVVKSIESEFDNIIIGLNKYPPDLSIRPVVQERFLEKDKINFPLKYFDKKEIIQKFFEIGIEELLPITHSCGMNGNVPCGECFNCKERRWAYKELGMDPNLGI